MYRSLIFSFSRIARIIRRTCNTVPALKHFADEDGGSSSMAPAITSFDQRCTPAPAAGSHLADAIFQRIPSGLKPDLL